MKIIQLFADMNGTGETAGWIPPSGDLTSISVEVKRYGTRVWAVYMGGQLLCVTEYLKGARAVKSLVEQLQDALRQAQALEPVAKPIEPMEPMSFDVAETVGA